MHVYLVYYVFVYNMADGYLVEDADITNNTIEANGIQTTITLDGKSFDLVAICEFSLETMKGGEPPVGEKITFYEEEKQLLREVLTIVRDSGSDLYNRVGIQKNDYGKNDLSKAVETNLNHLHLGLRTGAGPSGVPLMGKLHAELRKKRGEDNFFINVYHDNHFRAWDRSFHLSSFFPEAGPRQQVHALNVSKPGICHIKMDPIAALGDANQDVIGFKWVLNYDRTAANPGGFFYFSVVPLRENVLTPITRVFIDTINAFFMAVPILESNPLLHVNGDATRDLKLLPRRLMGAHAAAAHAAHAHAAARGLSRAARGPDPGLGGHDPLGFGGAAGPVPGLGPAFGGPVPGLAPAFGGPAAARGPPAPAGFGPPPPPGFGGPPAALGFGRGGPGAAAAPVFGRGRGRGPARGPARGPPPMDENNYPALGRGGTTLTVNKVKVGKKSKKTRKSKKRAKSKKTRKRYKN